MTRISMDRVAFAKMSGSGNDFILIDHRSGGLDGSVLDRFIAGICRRRLSVGADGVILIESSATSDFRWRFFNADGSGAEMCGNGARCAARFAYLQGICGTEVRFETAAGLLHAQVNAMRVKVRITEPHSLRLEVPITVSVGTLTVSSVNTGVPHEVVTAEEVEKVDLAVLGREKAVGCHTGCCCTGRMAWARNSSQPCSPRDCSAPVAATGSLRAVRVPNAH